MRAFALLVLALVVWDPDSAHASTAPGDSVHTCVVFDYEQWRREHHLPAAKRTTEWYAGAKHLIQESGSQPEPPFSGTVWIDPDIITPSDPTVFEDITAAGRGERTMFDWRVDGLMITVNAYLFNAQFNDGLTTEIQVNPEFGGASAALAEASKYGRAIGHLPTVLRTGVKTVLIHKGDQRIAVSQNSIVIYVDVFLDWRKEFLEEVLVHEGAHTSLDATHSKASDWITAQEADGNYISSYARDYPKREDIAESFLPYLAVRYRSARISRYYERTILETIPNRIAYFDRLLQVSASNDMHPITEDLADEQPFEWPPELVACSQQLYVPNENDGDKWVNLELYNPNQISRFLPITAGKETEIIFVNNSTIEVLFYWLDFGLSENYYGRVASCDSTIQHTFAGHIWVVKDQHGKDLAMFQAESKTGRAFIGPRTPTEADDDEQQGSASAQLAKVSGDEQQGSAGTALAHPFVVSVLDQNGDPFAGATVVFAVTSGEGRLSIETTVTDSSGKASSKLTLGRKPGSTTVVVTVAGIDQPVTFIAEAQATPDFDGDGTVGFGDFVQFASQFGLRQSDEEFDGRFDLDGNGEIGFSDFVIFAGAFGKNHSSG